MRAEDLKQIRQKWLDNHVKYKMCHWTTFDYNILSNIMWMKKAGRGDNKTYNDIIIMGDTETSKKYDDGRIYENHVCAWTISLRAFDRNIATLYGHRPDTMIECMEMIQANMHGEITFIYFHNLAYDYIFLRKFLYKVYGHPVKQLNTKSHYPINIEFSNGLVLKDSLILFQRKLEKVAEDLDVEHKKAVGKWEYSKLRSQHEDFTADELEYIEHDTLAGVECIQKYMDTLGKRIYSMPYTATGIPREECRKRGHDYNAHDKYLRQAPETYDEQLMLEQVYHGGYTHGNRHFLNMTMGPDEEMLIKCKDFASSYPFVLLSEKYPTERFTDCRDMTIDEIINSSDEYATICKLILYKPRLKDDFTAMPALQYSKCIRAVNPILDNGRVLAAAYIEILIDEQGLSIINEQYTWDGYLCTECKTAHKNYLPKWLTDYIFELFEDKTKLKGGDPVLYSLKKSTLNSIYGCCVQKPVKQNIIEDYDTGEFALDKDEDVNEIYAKHLKKYTSILPYQWGVWCTAYAMKNLFELGKCIDYENGGQWLYSDTDSIYAMNWNQEKVDAYNSRCKDKLIANGYGPVLHNDREYWLGIAEDDATYTEYRYCGAKRYCGRSIKDGELHITVAGVPKSGAKCLNDNIENFTKGLVFPGKITGKQLHTYFFVDDIYTDANGNITGDSIDLSPCDYLLDQVEQLDWETIFQKEIEVVEYYDEETII